MLIDKHSLRKGIAMIELIFAIVILGITMMSAPMLISQSSKSNLVAFQQESIALAASQTAALMTHAWDENNTVDAVGAALSILFVPPVVDGGIADDALSATAPAPSPANTIRGNPIFPNARLRRFNPALNLFATPFLGQDGAEADDDIDDFIANPLTLQGVILNNANQGEYMDVNITLNTAVVYANDAAVYNIAGMIVAPDLAPVPVVDSTSQGLTNIKSVTVTLISNSPAVELADKTIIMNAFICNIGAVNIPTVTGI